MKYFFRYILVGGLALIPLFVVLQIVMWGENIIEGILDSLFIYTNNTFISIGAIIVIILFLAFIGSSIEKVGKSLLVHFIDTALEKLPAIGTIYGMVKKITELFKPNAKSVKREVVLIEYPKKGLWVPAYVLNKLDDIFVLFIPTSPNPTSGYTVIVDKIMVKSTTLTISEASQFIVSMGADFVKKEELSVIIKEANKLNEIK